MQLEWKNGETYETDRPAEVERSAQKVKVRRNITRETRTTEDGQRKVWVYEYANMTHEQYETYKEQIAQLDAPIVQMIVENGTAQLEVVAALYEEILTTKENQQAIMEGLAEIYEMGVTAE